jgi:transketolase
MADYNRGISYLRTTRSETPVMYAATHEFKIGGCTVLKQSATDVACVIAAGITVFEALRAYELLQRKGINIAVIDLYSIKPLDAATIVSVAQQCNNRIITVEDHYIQGGLGEAVTYAVRNHACIVTCLAVTHLPRSGMPQELLADAGINADAIENAVCAT